MPDICLLLPFFYVGTPQYTHSPHKCTQITFMPCGTPATLDLAKWWCPGIGAVLATCVQASSTYHPLANGPKVSIYPLTQLEAQY